MTTRSLLIVLMVLAVTGSAIAEKKTYLEGEAGEKIEETVYEEGDREYRYEKKRVHYNDDGYKIREEQYLLANDYNDLGVEKTVKSYFPNGRLKAVEVVFRPEKAMMAGYERIFIAYDITGVRRRMEIYFTDDQADKRVYSRSVSYYDPVGVISRTIYYFTQRVSDANGYHRIEEQYDRKGNKISETIYGRDGNEF